jgi:hypothetical protein
MPTDPRPNEGEFIIWLDPSRRPDDYGRLRFYTFWYDPKTPGEGGPPDHVRGQISYADPAEIRRNLYKAGATTVRVIDHKPSWLSH